MASTRVVQLHTELGEGIFLFHKMRARSRLGRLYGFELELLSESDVVALEDVLGTSMTVELVLADGVSRHFNGLVGQCRYAGSIGHFIRYQVVLRPWLWLLTRSCDWRIFQNQTALDIIKTIFGKYGAAEFEDRTTETPPVREYCVQYGESDFNFVSRLMEAEGICYYFVHRKDGHKLVLADSYASYDTVSGLETIPYLPEDGQARRDRDHLYRWTASLQITSGAYVTTAFDFTKPSADLEVELAQPKGHAEASYEVYEFPGPHLEKGVGKREVQLRLEELQTPHNQIDAAGLVPALAEGALFTLESHPRGDQNVEYLVIETTHDVTTPDYRSGAGEDESDEAEAEACVVTLSAIPAEQPFRPERTTPRPVLRGPETAIVVGRAGEEIWTDKYARVKVQFPWDRLGGSDENSSCWLRVSQLWAGPGFGGIHIPRMGQEVLIAFLHGDPDQPYVVGRLYNGEAMPPYALPGNATQSGIKSNSSKGGDGSNELRFEDSTGNEEVWLHAQKDWNTVVENDNTESVGHDQTLSVGNDRTRDVTANEKVTVGGNQSIAVIGNQTVAVTGNRTDTVSQNEARTVLIAQQQTVGAGRNVSVGATQAHEVGVNDTWGIGGFQQIGIGREQTVGIGSDQTVKIGGDQSTDVAKNRKLDVKGSDTVSVGKARTTSVKDDDSLSVAKKLAIDAGDEITITTGKASITMKKDGTITIKGKDITIDGSGKITVKATGNVVIKGDKVLAN